MRTVQKAPTVLATKADISSDGEKRNISDCTTDQ